MKQYTTVDKLLAKVLAEVNSDLHYCTRTPGSHNRSIGLALYRFANHNSFSLGVAVLGKRKIYNSHYLDLECGLSELRAKKDDIVNWLYERVTPLMRKDQFNEFKKLVDALVTVK